MPGLNMGIVKSLALPVPPVDLQEAFKTHLETANELQAAAEYQAKAFNSLFVSLQHHAFRGEL